MSFEYKTLKGASEGLYKECGSKFISYAYPVSTEDQVHRLLGALKQAHPKARHRCYAYRLTPSGELSRSNDAGEPTGTAGRPILGQIQTLGLTNTLVVVIRYFGGKLLGVPGLINAYRESSRDALQKAEVIIKCVTLSYTIKFDYAVMGTLMDAITKSKVAVVRRSFDAAPYIVMEVPAQDVEAILDRIIAHTLSLPLEMVADQREFDKLSIVLNPA